VRILKNKIKRLKTCLLEKAISQILHKYYTIIQTHSIATKKVNWRVPVLPSKTKSNPILSNLHSCIELIYEKKKILQHVPSNLVLKFCPLHTENQNGLVGQIWSHDWRKTVDKHKKKQSNTTVEIVHFLNSSRIKRADPVPEAPTRVGSGEGNNRRKVLPPQKFCRETASNPGPGDSAS
jgi:hypothetical protein